MKVATLTAVRPSGRFGELALDGHTLTGFREKPEQESAFINGGFFVLNRDIAEYLDDDDCVFERAPLERLAGEGNLHAYQHPGFWQCMDTYREPASWGNFVVARLDFSFTVSPSMFAAAFTVRGPASAALKSAWAGGDLITSPPPNPASHRGVPV